MLELLGGILLAWRGGEWFVRALVAGAKWPESPPGLVGLTLAAFATSAPEPAVGVQSAAARTPQLSLGDTLGSNVANAALFLSLGLLVSANRVPSTTARRDYWAALLTPFLVALVGMDGFISRTDAAVLLFGFLVWLVLVTHSPCNMPERGPVMARCPGSPASPAPWGCGVDAGRTPNE